MKKYYGINEELNNNIYSSRPYQKLGDEYFQNKSYHQAYFCYEQSVFLGSEDREQLLLKMKDCESSCPSPIPKVAFVILTYNNLDYSKNCIASIRKYNSKSAVEIIIVDNGSTDGTVNWIKEQKDIKYHINRENEGFPRGCNQGVLLADPTSDILFLNNDTIIMPNSILNLRLGLYEDTSIGAVGAVSNSVSYSQQISEQFDSLEEYREYAEHNNIPGGTPYEYRMKLIGFAMLIKRTALETVGLMDERFSPGNYEDDDLSIRLIFSGYKLFLCKNSFIYHFGSVSFRQQKDKYSELLTSNRLKFHEKWHIYASELSLLSAEICDMVHEPFPKSCHVLNIDYGCGAQEIKIQSTFPELGIVGVYMNKLQKNYKEKVIAETAIHLIDYDKLKDEKSVFEYILLTDTLCRVKNVGRLLEDLKKLLSASGKLLIRVPNQNHARWALTPSDSDCKRYDYGPRDEGYIHLYNEKTLTDQLTAHGYQVESRSYSTVPLSEEENVFVDGQNGSSQAEYFQLFITAAVAVLTTKTVQAQSKGQRGSQ